MFIFNLFFTDSKLKFLLFFFVVRPTTFDKASAEGGSVSVEDIGNGGVSASDVVSISDENSLNFEKI